MGCTSRDDSLVDILFTVSVKCGQAGYTYCGKRFGDDMLVDVNIILLFFFVEILGISWDL